MSPKEEYWLAVAPSVVVVVGAVEGVVGVSGVIEVVVDGVIEVVVDGVVEVVVDGVVEVVVDGVVEVVVDGVVEVEVVVDGVVEVVVDGIESSKAVLYVFLKSFSIVTSSPNLRYVGLDRDQGSKKGKTSLDPSGVGVLRK